MTKKSFNIIKDETGLLWQLVFNGRILSQHNTYLNAKQQLIRIVNGAFMNRESFGEYPVYYYNWIKGSSVRRKGAYL